MKKFYTVLALITLMVVLEIAKYFANFICFYLFFAIQLVLLVAIIVLMCKGAKHKAISSLMLFCASIYIITPTIIAFANAGEQNYEYVVHAGGGFLIFNI